MNVVLVTIDTLRADMLSCYGGPVPTPNLDTLAARGARFTFAHAHAVVTLVSHTSILTGELPYEHGIRDNAGFRVASGTKTAATRLKAAGFATGAFIGGYPLTKRFGLTPGFDEYNDQLPEEHGIGAFSLPERRAEDVVTPAVAWISRQTGRFFSWVHVYDPHAPYTPPPPFLEQFHDHPYYGEIAYTDHALGPLFSELARLSRPTLVIVTADHGESLGEHGELTHGLFAYEATLHIPMIIAVIPRAGAAMTASAGVVVDAPVTHIDILPTILDAVGLPAEAALKGGSLRDVIRTDRRSEGPSYFEAMTFNLTRGWAPLRGVLDGRTKFIDLPIPELYNLYTDPTEQTNLAPTEPDRLTQFHSDLVVKFNVAPPQPSMVESASVRTQLGSLGYLSTRATGKAAYTAADDPKTLMPVDRAVHDAQDLYEKGHVEEAIAQMSRLMVAYPAMGDVAVYLAYAQWETGQSKAAIATLENALAHHATDSNVVIRLGIYLSESHTDPNRAIALLETLPATNTEALNALGIAEVDANRLDEAITTFRRLLALDPTNGLALQNIASIQLKQALALPANDGRLNALHAAERTVEQALEADPALPDAYNTKAVILVNLGRTPEAIDCWKRAVGLDPQNFEALDNLIIALNDARQTSEALKYASQFVNTAPPDRYAARIAELRRFLGG